MRSMLPCLRRQPVSAYLKVIGSGDAPLPGPYAESYAEFRPGRPPDNISKGDFLVLYAAGWKRIFAVARVMRRALLQQ